MSLDSEEQREMLQTPQNIENLFRTLLCIVEKIYSDSELTYWALCLLNGIIEDKNSSPALLQANSWGEDIFYDRSNIYNSWFKLTGITQFEGGFKAIINGQIVHEYDRVRGFRVIEIIENQVVLERDQYSVKLKLEK